MPTRLSPVFAAALLAAGLATAQTRPVSEELVRQVHASAILIDTHNDITYRTVQGWDIGKRDTSTHTDIPRLREGGVAATFFAAYVSPSYVQSEQSAHRALEMIDTVRRDIVERHPDHFVLTTSAEGIRAARKAGKMAALIGIEGGHAIEDSLRLLRTYHDLGVRYMTLTHNNTNNWAGSSGDPKQPAPGLSAFGRQVIAEMNRLGMIVDVSHVSDKTFWDVLATSGAPVFASHSSCRGISNIPRNLSDEMIAALAKKGGLIQINFGCEFLSRKSADSSPWSNPAVRAAIQERAKSIADPKQRREAVAKFTAEAEAKIVPATIDDVVAHIDHAVRIAGVDAVGIGSDYDGVTCVPTGLEDVSRFPNLTRKLLEKGYSPAAIRKIYGENFLRLFAAVEQHSASAKRR